MVAAALSATLIGSAHYAGFVVQFPPQLMSVILPATHAAFIGTFVLHLLVCLIVGRVAGIIFVAPYVFGMSVLNASSKVKRKTYRQFAMTLRIEPFLISAIGAIISILILNSWYLHISSTNGTILTGMILILLLFVSALRVSRGSLAVRKRIRDITNPHRKAIRSNFVSATSYSLIGILIILSFLAGLARYDAVVEQPPVMFTNSRLAVPLHIFINSGEQVVAIEVNSNGKNFRHLIVSKDSVIVATPSIFPSEDFSIITK